MSTGKRRSNLQNSKDSEERNLTIVLLKTTLYLFLSYSVHVILIFRVLHFSEMQWVKRTEAYQKHIKSLVDSSSDFFFFFNAEHPTCLFIPGRGNHFLVWCSEIFDHIEFWVFLWNWDILRVHCDGRIKNPPRSSRSKWCNFSKPWWVFCVTAKKSLNNAGKK